MSWVCGWDVLPCPGKSPFCLAFITCTCESDSPSPRNPVTRFCNRGPHPAEWSCWWIWKPYWMFSKVAVLSQTRPLSLAPWNFPQVEKGSWWWQSVPPWLIGNARLGTSACHPMLSPPPPSPGHCSVISHSMPGEGRGWLSFQTECPVTPHSLVSSAHLLLWITLNVANETYFPKPCLRAHKALK